MKTKSSYLVLFLLAAGLCAAFFLIRAANDKSDSPQQSKNNNAAVSSNIKAGKKLAEKYCSTCHTYPEPKLLDKETWASQVMPNMGPRFGIFYHNHKKYPIEQTPNLPENLYPEKQLIADKKWQQILDYYKNAAPEKLSVPKRKKIISDALFFKVRSPTFRTKIPPKVTAVKFDPEKKSIYFSDASQNQFYIFNQKLQFENRFALKSAISDIQLIEQSSQSERRNLLTTFIGDVNPSDALNGFIQPVWYNPVSEQGGAKTILADSLARPVEAKLIDLNEDNQKDLLINEFGHRTGGLFWLENMGENKFSERKMLINTPGCVESHVLDLTSDGLEDIISLCSQLEQAIFLFKNNGTGNFTQKKLLQFEIVAGSSSFKLHDFNSDGALDILYTSGDNADYSITFKPYHGIYIYLNDGNNNFSKRWFYPNNGSYDAFARDFDKDGDTDIAAISFFADYDNNPREGFVYFQNEGDFTFTPYHPPKASNGRWIAMDVADWTGNGRDDIILANFSLGPTRVKSLIQKKFTEAPHFIILENHSK